MTFESQHPPPDTILPEPVSSAVSYERTTWVTGPVSKDPFYRVPASTLTAAPGTLLKLEAHHPTAGYTLPPAVALSRFIYQSRTSRGRPVPVSALIIWPHTPRLSPRDGKPCVVTWAHGTSGISPDSAPSHTHGIWQHFGGPYALVMAGYVVVATDYAGLGVAADGNGRRVLHEYMFSESQAEDVVNAVIAVREAFVERLSEDWVAVGHSQGGGATWAVARREAKQPTNGYRGTVAIAPMSNLLEEMEPLRSVMVSAMVPAMEEFDEKFRKEEFLTPEGMERWGICEWHGGMSTSIVPLLIDVKLLADGWSENATLLEVSRKSRNGGKDIAGPMLVLHGDADETLRFDLCEKELEETIKKFPDSEVLFVRYTGIKHVSAATAGQHTWLDWIRDRFEGKPHGKFEKKTCESVMPIENYQADLAYHLEVATEFYHAAS